MTYKLIASKTFLRELKKFPEETKQRIAKAVDELVSRADSGTRLKGELEGLWRLRVGEYRIIYEIDHAKETVILLDVGLRKHVYS